MFADSPREAIEAALLDFKNAMHTAYPARVVRYYADRHTVDVQVCVMREVPGEEHEEDLYEEVPELVNVPVQWRAAARVLGDGTRSRAGSGKRLAPK